MKIDEVIEKMLSKGYVLEIENYSWFNENDVIDENKSVVWNKEEVKRRNQENVEKMNERLKLQVEMYRKMKQDFIEAYYKEVPELNKNQIKLIYEKANGKAENYEEMFHLIEEISSFAIELIHLNKK